LDSVFRPAVAPLVATLVATPAVSGKPN
jgi:hypothetical protein